MDEKALNSLKRTRKSKEQIHEYFESCRESIDESNLFMLRKACKNISILYLIMIGIALAFVPGFRITLPHLIMLPLMVMYYLINLNILREGGTLGTTAAYLTCYGFYLGLALVFITIDTITYPNIQAFFLPMLMLVYPALFIDRMWKYGVEELIILAIFFAFSYANKEWAIARRDVYMGLGAFCVSMLLAQIILDVRSSQGLIMKELRGISSLDKLTHVLNKGALLSKIDNYFLQKPEEDSCAMCIIDMDDFKQVNDNLGHDTGDKLLEKIGTLLIDSFRAYDIVGRYGGDEFVVLMPKMSSLEILQRRCQTVQEEIRKIDLGNSKPFSASIGAVICSDFRSGKSIFSIADDALYKSKIEGKGSCTIWVYEQFEHDRPLFIAVGSDDCQLTQHMSNDFGNSYKIVQVNNDNDAIHQISQYKNLIEGVAIEVDSVSGIGLTTLKYIKSRECFAAIPTIAIVSNEQDSLICRKYKTDVVLTSDTPYIEYRDRINKLIGI